MDNTYIELNKNDKKTVQISVWRATGSKFIPSGASYEVKDSRKDTTIISKSSANVNSNNIYTEITSTVTASANQYDLNWELRKDDGSIYNHCTKILVLDNC